jgi:hypothetical protein
MAGDYYSRLTLSGKRHTGWKEDVINNQPEQSSTSESGSDSGDEEALACLV